MEKMETNPLGSREEKNESLFSLYKNEDYVTLYRYENPETQYDNSREGIVSKKEIIGTWFTTELKDLKDYIKSRPVGGKIITIRIKGDELENYDASKLEETKEMDIEKDNYIIPSEIQQESRIEIPLTIETSNPKKFIFKDWTIIDEFVDENISTSDKILKFIEK